jgi:hypothetical protein
MLWAQVFGLHRGFVCDCGGAAEVTRLDHCHGLDPKACHEHEQESPWHHDRDDHDDDAGTHEHAALIERLVASSAAGLHVMAPAPLVSVIEMPAWLAVEPVLFEEMVSSKSDPPRRRSWPQVLTRSVVLRI